MPRNHLPPQIQRIELKGRENGRPKVRYQVTTDTGVDPVTGKRHQSRKRYKTEAEARQALSTTQHEVHKGTYAERRGLTVTEACERWIDSKHSLKESTIRGHETKLSPIKQELGDKDIQDLTKTDLDKLVKRLRAGEVENCKKWSARSVNYMLSIFAAVLDSQMKQGHLPRNVAKLVDKLPGERQEMKTLSEADMFRIFDHQCRDRHIWMLALNGLRRGEVSALRWEHINFADRTVRIAENRVAVGRDIRVGTPKSLRSRRVLPMPEDLYKALREAHTAQVAEMMALGSDHQGVTYVASDIKGLPYHPNLITFRWGRLLDGLGIDRVRLHDARHSCGTLMHMRGVPTIVISAWLGHASAAFTMNTYIHSRDESLVLAAQSMARAIN